MRYEMKERLLATTRGFDFLDENGSNAFVAKSKALTLNIQMSVLDAQGREIAGVHQHLWPPSSKFSILEDGVKTAVVRRKWGMTLRDNFVVDVVNGAELEVWCTGLMKNVQFFRTGKLIGQATKNTRILSEDFTIEMDEGESTVLILATMLAIQVAYH